MAFINPQTYTVRRRATGSYVDGVYTEGPDTTFPIKAGIQPTTGKELDLVDEQEGSRLRGGRKMYTKSFLRTVVQEGPNRCDVVEIDDDEGAGVELWEVHFSNNRSKKRYNLPTAHFKYLLQRADEQNDINA